MTNTFCKQHKRILALGTAFSFLVTALPMPLAHASVVQTLPLSSSLEINTVPSEYGKISGKFSGSGSSTVVILQDAHSNPEAQRNLWKLTEYFQGKRGFDLVGVEGASGDLRPEFLKAFPDTTRLRTVLEEYLDRGELTGPNAAALMSPYPAVYSGVENWDLYWEGIQYFKQALAIRPKLEEKISQEILQLESQKKEIYSKELLRVDTALNRFLSSGQGFEEAIRVLAKKDPPAPGSPLRLVADKLLSTASGENGVAGIEKEAGSLGDFVKSLIEKSPDSVFSSALKAQFQEKRQAFRTGQADVDEFVSFLIDHFDPGQKGFPVSEKLRLSAENHRSLKELEGAEFLKEFHRYAESVKQKLFRSDEEKRMDEKSSALALAEKLIRLELNLEEWQNVKALLAQSELPAFSPEEILVHRQFYENALKRDEAMSSRLIQMMESEKRDKALIVAGGFHAEGLAAEFEKKGLSWVVVLPKIENISETSLYLEQMKGHVSWEKYFTPANGGVPDFYAPFVRAVRDRLLETENDSEKKAVLKNWRDEIIRLWAEQGKTFEAGSQTRFVDESLGVAPWGAGEDKNSLVLARIERFSDRLRLLWDEQRFTAENVLGALSGSMTPAPVVAGQLVSTNRSELRVEGGIPIVRSDNQGQATIPPGAVYQGTISNGSRNIRLSRADLTNLPEYVIRPLDSEGNQSFAFLATAWSSDRNQSRSSEKAFVFGQRLIVKHAGEALFAVTIGNPDENGVHSLAIGNLSTSHNLNLKRFKPAGNVVSQPSQSPAPASAVPAVAKPVTPKPESESPAAKANPQPVAVSPPSPSPATPRGGQTGNRTIAMLRGPDEKGYTQFEGKSSGDGRFITGIRVSVETPQNPRTSPSLQGEDPIANYRRVANGYYELINLLLSKENMGYKWPENKFERAFSFMWDLLDSQKIIQASGSDSSVFKTYGLARPDLFETPTKAAEAYLKQLKEQYPTNWPTLVANLANEVFAFYAKEGVSSGIVGGGLVGGKISVEREVLFASRSAGMAKGDRKIMDIPIYGKPREVSSKISPALEAMAMALSRRADDFGKKQYLLHEGEGSATLSIPFNEAGTSGVVIHYAPGGDFPILVSLRTPDNSAELNRGRVLFTRLRALGFEKNELLAVSGLTELSFNNDNRNANLPFLLEQVVLAALSVGALSPDEGGVLAAAPKDFAKDTLPVAKDELQRNGFFKVILDGKAIDTTDIELNLLEVDGGFEEWLNDAARRQDQTPPGQANPLPQDVFNRFFDQNNTGSFLDWYRYARLMAVLGKGLPQGSAVGLGDDRRDGGRIFSLGVRTEAGVLVTFFIREAEDGTPIDAYAVLGERFSEQSEGPVYDWRRNRFLGAPMNSVLVSNVDGSTTKLYNNLLSVRDLKDLLRGVVEPKVLEADYDGYEQALDKIVTPMTPALQVKVYLLQALKEQQKKPLQRNDGLITELFGKVQRIRLLSERDEEEIKQAIENTIFGIATTKEWVVAFKDYSSDLRWGVPVPEDSVIWFPAWNDLKSRMANSPNDFPDSSDWKDQRLLLTLDEGQVLFSKGSKQYRYKMPLAEARALVDEFHQASLVVFKNGVEDHTGRRIAVRLEQLFSVELKKRIQADESSGNVVLELDDWKNLRTRDLPPHVGLYLQAQQAARTSDATLALLRRELEELVTKRKSLVESLDQRRKELKGLIGSSTDVGVDDRNRDLLRIKTGIVKRDEDSLAATEKKIRALVAQIESVKKLSSVRFPDYFLVRTPEIGASLNEGQKKEILAAIAAFAESQRNEILSVLEKERPAILGDKVPSGQVSNYAEKIFAARIAPRKTFIEWLSGASGSEILDDVLKGGKGKVSAFVSAETTLKYEWESVDPKARPRLVPGTLLSQEAIRSFRDLGKVTLASPTGVVVDGKGQQGYFLPDDGFFDFIGQQELAGSILIVEAASRGRIIWSGADWRDLEDLISKRLGVRVKGVFESLFPKGTGALALSIRPDENWALLAQEFLTSLKKTKNSRSELRRAAGTIAEKFSLVLVSERRNRIDDLFPAAQSLVRLVTIKGPAGLTAFTEALRQVAANLENTRFAGNDEAISDEVYKKAVADLIQTLETPAGSVAGELDGTIALMFPQEKKQGSFVKQVFEVLQKGPGVSVMVPGLKGAVASEVSRQSRKTGVQVQFLKALSGRFTSEQVIPAGILDGAVAPQLLPESVIAFGIEHGGVTDPRIKNYASVLQLVALVHASRLIAQDSSLGLASNRALLKAALLKALGLAGYDAIFSQTNTGAFSISSTAARIFLQGLAEQKIAASA